MPSTHLFFNREHSNTRGFYTATYNTMNTHIFFCTNDECGNVAPEGDALCMDCEPTHVCSGEWDYDLGYRVCDNSDDEDCPQHEPQCTCDGSGRMCDLCAEEYMQSCLGCGVSSHLWTDDMYCRKCYVERYGDEFPLHPPRKSLEEMRSEIADIEARLLSNMTKNQKDDWRWLLQNRRTDLAEVEKKTGTSVI